MLVGKRAFEMEDLVKIGILYTSLQFSMAFGSDYGMVDEWHDGANLIMYRADGASLISRGKHRLSCLFSHTIRF